MIGIYKITNPNGKVYIGQSINLERRLYYYKNLKQSNSQILLNRSFLKYGTVNHTFEVIEECDIELLNKKERYYQEYYDCINPKKGLNCKLQGYGDNSGKMSEETKLKISKGNKGKIRTEETKKLLSNINKGKKRSEESKLKMSKIALNMSEETKLKMSNSRKLGKNGLAKSVICTKSGKIWTSITECALDINIKMKLLSSYLNNVHPNKTTIIYLKDYEQQ